MISGPVLAVDVDQLVLYLLLVAHDVVQFQILLLPQHLKVLQLVKLLLLHALLHLLADHPLIVIL